MDGTLSRFYKNPKFLEHMLTPGYFSSLDPYESMVETVNRLKDMGCEVFILSAFNSAFEVEEKKEWLSRFIPALDEKHTLFCKAGTDKSSFVHSLGYELSQCMLVDDYSKNLIEWTKKGGKAVKAKNEINCKGVSWQGKRVDANGDAVAIVRIILGG